MAGGVNGPCLKYVRKGDEGTDRKTTVALLFFFFSISSWTYYRKLRSEDASVSDLVKPTSSLFLYVIFQSVIWDSLPLLTVPCEGGGRKKKSKNTRETYEV